jgi:hypothetical protein
MIALALFAAMMLLAHLGSVILAMRRYGRSRPRRGMIGGLSIGIQSGPLIGVQKGPLWRGGSWPEAA